MIRSVVSAFIRSSKKWAWNSSGANARPNTQDTEAHGSPLGEDEIRMVKESMGFDPEETFLIPEEVYEFFAEAMQRGRRAHAEWEQRLPG